MSGVRQRGGNEGEHSGDIEMGHTSNTTTVTGGEAANHGSPNVETEQEANGEPHRHTTRIRKALTDSRMPHGISKHGESGRRGVSPLSFILICFNSSCTISKYVNVLWPFVPAAIAVYCTMRESNPRLVFALNYVAMVPTANLIGFAGQELARKLPKVFGVLLETFLGSVVEIILLMVLLGTSSPHAPTDGSVDENFLIPVIRDAILGSILANMLLCLGLCFFVGGMRQTAQQFHPAISEVGSGLLLTAAFGLAIPRAFYTGVVDQLGSAIVANDTEARILEVSRATAVMLLVAFLTYVWFQMRSHHSLYDEVLEADEEKDLDKHRDHAKDKLTLSECVLALTVALACVSAHAVFLVEEIPHLLAADSGLSEMFVGLILVPLVEKASEHLTAVDEAWDNQMNFALAHVLGSTIQTALLNASLVVIVGWGLGVDMDLNFSTFQVVLLILSILVVGNFIRDQESNYLEGALCILVYVIIAVAAFYFPNRPEGEKSEGGESSTGEEAVLLLARAAAASAKAALL